MQGVAWHKFETAVNAVGLPGEKRLYSTGKMIILLVCCLDYSYCSHNTLKISSVFLRDLRWSF